VKGQNMTDVRSGSRTEEEERRESKKQRER
jgi:hypothetical protein